jgi:hypothetical protein
VFIDGGLLNFPGIPPEQAAGDLLAPFLQKLRRTWTSVEEYIAFWASTALYPDGLDAYGRVHLAYDLAGDSPSLRARLAEGCLAPDLRDCLETAAVSKCLEQLAALVPKTTVTDVPGTNHHTILFSRPGARAVARAITAFTG